MFQFVFREDEEEEEKNGEEAEEENAEQRRRWRERREPSLELIRYRPGGLVHSGSLRWMTSLWRKTVSEREEAFFPLLCFSLFFLSFPSLL